MSFYLPSDGKARLSYRKREDRNTAVAGMEDMLQFMDNSDSAEEENSKQDFQEQMMDDIMKVDVVTESYNSD